MVIIFVFLQASGPHGSQGLVAPKAKYQSHNYAIFVSKIYERCSTVLLLPWQISLRHGGALGSVLHHASEKRTWPRLPCVIPKGTFLNYYLRLRWFGIPSPVRHHSSSKQLRPLPHHSSPRPRPSWPLVFFRGDGGPKTKGQRSSAPRRGAYDSKGQKGKPPQKCSFSKRQRAKRQRAYNSKGQKGSFFKIHVFKGAVGSPLFKNPWKKHQCPPPPVEVVT